MKKKIVYISDYTLEQCNSVRDILHNMLAQFNSDQHEQIIVSSFGTSSHPIKTSLRSGFKTYYAGNNSCKSILRDSQLTILQKLSFLLKVCSDRIILRIPRIRNIHKLKCQLRYFDKIIKAENPDIIVYFAFSPQKGFSQICKKRKVPYISILYDTYLERPYITEQEIVIETEEIAHSVGYFVPNFFIDGYLKHYSFHNIHPYHLPLLIPENKILAAYENKETVYDFSYFGQLQSFRNVERIKTIFKEAGIALDIFSAENKLSDDTYIYHQGVTDDQLFKVVASSNFLVAFDNGEPYTHYLPSKVYLYVSFTKPIIVFGNNKESALKSFLKDYPDWFYCDIDDYSIEELRKYIHKARCNRFDPEIYSNYTKWLPQNALTDITALIENQLNQ